MRAIILIIALLAITTSSFAQTDIDNLRSAIKILDTQMHDYDKLLLGFKEHSTKSKAKRLYENANLISSQVSECIRLSRIAYNSYEEDNDTRRSISNIKSSLSSLYDYVDEMVSATIKLKNVSCLTDNLYEQTNCDYKSPFNSLVKKYNACLPSFNNIVTYVNKLP